MSLFQVSFDSKVVIIKLHSVMTPFDWQKYFKNSLFVLLGAHRTANFIIVVVVIIIIIIHMVITAPECRHWYSLVVKTKMNSLL